MIRRLKKESIRRRKFEASELSSSALRLKTEFLRVIDPLYDSIIALDKLIDKVLPDLGYSEFDKLDDCLEQLNNIGITLQKEADDFVDTEQKWNE